MKSLIRRPSPALVVAIVALIAAMGGTALAGGPITKKKAKKVANNVVTQRAPGLSVAHATTANTANTAGVADKVGPLSATKFDYRATASSGQVTIATIGNALLLGTCDAGPDTSLELGTNSNNGLAKSQGLDEGATPIEDDADDLDPGDTIFLNGTAGTEANGTFDFVSSGGSVATGTWATEDTQLADCQAWGTAFNS
jgi:hypothetical protein